MDEFNVKQELRIQQVRFFKRNIEQRGTHYNNKQKTRFRKAEWI